MVSHHGTMAFGAIFLAVKDHPGPCGPFSSIPGLHPIDASHSLPFVTTRNFFNHLSNGPWKPGVRVRGAKLPLAKNHWFISKLLIVEFVCEEIGFKVIFLIWTKGETHVLKM